MDETFTFSSVSNGTAEAASFDGGAGNDTLDATFGTDGSATGGLTTSFTDNGDGTFSATYSRGNSGATGDDSVSIVNIENVFISVLGDNNGLGNEDSVRTGGGDDTIFTDNGNDMIDAGKGVDTVNGGTGDEFSDSDVISKDFSDVTTDISWNILTGAFSGPGSFTSLEAFGVLQTGSGNDTIVTSEFSNGVGNETVATGAGNDTVSVFNGIDDIDLGGGNDRLIIDWSGFFVSNAVMTLNEDAPGSYSGKIDPLGTGPEVNFSGAENFTILMPLSGGNGSNAADTIITGDGDDVISSGASSDRIDAGRGVDSVDGGEIGTDVDGLAKEFGAASAAVNINLDANTYSGPGGFTNLEWFIDLRTGNARDTVVTSNATDSNGGGDDLIRTRGSNDSVTLFNGNDTVYLGAGNDRLIIDYATYNTFNAGSTMTLTETSAGTYSGFMDTGTANIDVTFASVEHFTILTSVSGGNGFNLQDNIVTGDGDDVVATYASADRIAVGAGIDNVDGGSAVDGLGKEFGTDGAAININLDANTYSGPGSFTNLEWFIDLKTGNGNDVVVTSSVNETSSGGGDDTIFTRGGNDVVRLFTGNDNVDMGAGDDRLIIDYATYNYFAAGTSMTLTETSTGTYSGFLDSGTSNVDVTFAGVEHFTFLGNSTGGNGFNSADNITTGRGDDIIFTYHSNDTISGGAGNDTIDAGTGNDIVMAGAGADRIQGGAGADTLDGGLTGDFIDGGTGADAMTGGIGNDIYIVDDANDSVTENAREGRDEVRVALAAYSLGDDLEDLIGTSDAGQSLAGNALANDIRGGDGADVIDGGGGADVMRGGMGDDVYIVDDIGDRIVEQSGDDVDTVEASVGYVIAGPVENLTLVGPAAIDGVGNSLDNVLVGNAAANGLRGARGDDRLDGAGGSDTLEGGEGFDWLDGGAGADTLRGEVGQDRLFGGSYTDGLSGGIGRDILDGGHGEDRLFGGSGRDVLDGGRGADRLTGGGGPDRFVLADQNHSGPRRSEADRILDFTRGDDRIDLRQVDADVSTGADDAFSFIGADAFSGVASELRFAVIGGEAFVQGDTNGDGVADFSLWVDNVAAVQAGDFFL